MKHTRFSVILTDVLITIDFLLDKLNRQILKTMTKINPNDRNGQRKLHAAITQRHDASHNLRVRLQD